MHFPTFLIIYFSYSLAVFLLYGWDKFCAIHGMWRIRETVLLFPAVFFATPGALLGMLIFHHKTRHRSFWLAIFAGCLLHILVLTAWLALRK